MKLFRWLFLLILLTGAVLAKAANPIDIFIKTEDEGQYLRVFLYNNDNFFEDKLVNGDIVIKFLDNVNFKKGSIDPKTSDYIKKIKANPSNNSLIISLKGDKFSYRKFLSEGFSGIDINLGNKFAVVSQQSNKTQIRPIKLPPKQPAPKKTVSKNPAPKKQVKAQFVPKPTKRPVEKKLTDPQNKIKKSTQAKNLNSSPSIKNDNRGVLIADLPTTKSKDKTPDVKFISNEGDNFTLSFKWYKPNIAASIFSKAGYEWLVFDSYIDFEKTQAAKMLKKMGINYKQLYFLNNTIIKLKLNRSLSIAPAKINNDWLVSFYDSAKEEVKYPNITKYKDPSKLVISNNTRVNPIRIIDNIVGDEILIIPYAQDYIGFFKNIKNIDYEFLPTYQGIAIRLISDDVKVKINGYDIEITGPTDIIKPL